MERIKVKSQLWIWGFIIILGIIFIVKAFSVYQLSDVMLNEVHILSHIKNTFQKAVLTTYMPNLTYPLSEENESKNFEEFIMDKVWEEVPVYQYMKDYMTYETQVESKETYEQILASEAQNENSVDPETGEVTMAEGAVSLEETLPEEIPGTEEATAEAGTADNQTGENGQETAAASTLPFSLEQLDDYNFLYSTFYTGDTTTGINADQLNRAALMDKDMRVTVDSSVPQILIYHTHASEAYADSVEGDYSTTVVGVGERLAAILRDTYGYNVIHETGVYDIPRDDAYAKTPPVLENILNQNPSIDVIIDVHRDGVQSEEVKLVKEINGKQMAQFMFVNGLSYTNYNGDIDNLYNPYKADNLAFAFQLQLKATQYYNGLARKIYLKPYRFNLQYRPKSLLLEVGAQTNTLQEALNTMEPVAEILNKVLTGTE